MENEPPPSELTSVLRDQAFAEIVQVAAWAESYSRSIVEGAYRGDQLTVEVHLRQVRKCCNSLVVTYWAFLQGCG